jgi:hypothetical protein
METAGFFEIFLMFIRLHCVLLPLERQISHRKKCNFNSFDRTRIFTATFITAGQLSLFGAKKHLMSPFNSSPKIHVNIIFPHTSLHSPPYHVSCLSHAHDLIILTIIAMIASMKLLVMHFSPPSSYFILLKSSYSPHCSSSASAIVKDQVRNP